MCCKSGGQFWLIDGDGIVPAGENERLDNLALLAAQMPARWPDLAERARPPTEAPLQRTIWRGVSPGPRRGACPPFSPRR